MAENPVNSPFYIPANSRSEDTQGVMPPIDIIGALMQMPEPAVEAVELTEVDLSAEAVIDAEYVDLSDEAPAPEVFTEPAMEFPIEEADLFAPAEDVPLPEEDLSSLAAPVRRLDRAMRPVSVDELRRMIDTGWVGGASTDPFGERLRYTIRSLVRGL